MHLILRNWWRLGPNLANHYENIKLKLLGGSQLSRAWEPQTVQSLNLLVKAKAPEVVFIMETKQCSKRPQIVARKIKYEGCIVVDAIGRSGGLMLLWK